MSFCLLPTVTYVMLCLYQVQDHLLSLCLKFCSLWGREDQERVDRWIWYRAYIQPWLRTLIASYSWNFVENLQTALYKKEYEHQKWQMSSEPAARAY